ncbi:MAG: hypothetical protein EBU33_09570 [Sphingobacteriia bacterium]|nr:hypothetical protein [Sphingobacteriia bacterium]
MKKYGIFGWITFTNKPRSEQLLFNGITFDSFEEGWDWIYANDPNENDETGYYDDYYVELIEQ